MSKLVWICQEGTGLVTENMTPQQNLPGNMTLLQNLQENMFSAEIACRQPDEGCILLETGCLNINRPGVLVSEESA